MSFRLWHAAANQCLIIRYQRYGLLLMIGLCVLLWLGWLSAPKRLTLYVPPDLSSGVTQSVDTIPAPYLYSFAFQVWQELNYWPKETPNENGQWTYLDNIHTYWSYLTDDFRKQLLQEAHAQAKAQKLSRTRTMHPISAHQHIQQAVKQVNATTWIVQLDVQVIERTNGITVKDTHIRYHLYVLHRRISEHHNPYGLVLGGFAKPPQRLQTQ